MEQHLLRPLGLKVYKEAFSMKWKFRHFAAEFRCALGNSSGRGALIGFIAKLISKQNFIKPKFVAVLSMLPLIHSRIARAEPGIETRFRRRAVFLGLPLLLTSSAFAQQQAAQRPPIDPNTVQIKTQKLSDKVYMFQFVTASGGNVGGDVAAFVGNDGIALVDCGYAEMAAKLEATLKTVSDKPVKYILITHWHADHSSADAYFAKSAVVVAHENVRKHMQTGGRLFPPFPAAELPTLTFGDQITLDINGGEIHGIHFPGGHTNGDTVYFLPQANVVHMGDEFVNFDPPQFPAIDQDTDGSGGPQGLIAADEYVLAHTPDNVKVIPGHGNLATKEDVAKDLTLLKEAVAAVQAGINQGKTLDQLKRENVLVKWNYLFQGRFKPDTYIERLYNSLMLKK